MRFSPSSYRVDIPPMSLPLSSPAVQWLRRMGDGDASTKA